jgi:hypothetical protein
MGELLMGELVMGELLIYGLRDDVDEVSPGATR